NTGFPAYVATARQSKIDVHSSPGGPTVQTLSSPLPEGSPLTLLMTPLSAQPGGSWIHLFLPTKPNGSTGCVLLSEDSVHGDPHNLVVNASKHRLSVYKLSELQHVYPIGVGAPPTPTPPGDYYITELLKPQNPGVYGDYAYGLSGHSPTLQSFDGYDAEIG